jgi:hypothetical protein
VTFSLVDVDAVDDADTADDCDIAVEDDGATVAVIIVVSVASSCVVDSLLIDVDVIEGDDEDDDNDVVGGAPDFNCFTILLTVCNIHIQTMNASVNTNQDANLWLWTIFRVEIRGRICLEIPTNDITQPHGDCNRVIYYFCFTQVYQQPNGFENEFTRISVSITTNF